MKKLPTDLIFKLEHQFTLYLQRAGVTRASLSAIQLLEMQKAFYGGLGQMFFLLTQDVGDLKQRHQIETLESMQNQLGEFWEQAVKDHELNRLQLHPESEVKCGACNWHGAVKDIDIEETADTLKKGLCPRCKNPQLMFRV